MLSKVLEVINTLQNCPCWGEEIAVVIVVGDALSLMVFEKQANFFSHGLTSVQLLCFC